MFGKSKKINSGVNKVDKLVTGIIIGGAVASIFGLSKTKKGKEVTKKSREATKSFGKKVTPVISKGGKKAFGIFGKILVFFIRVFNNK